MITVTDHILYRHNQPVTFKQTPNCGGALLPKYLIIHYDAATNDTSALEWMLSKKSRVSAHLHITQAGKITQLAKFNVVCWHAGASEWKGVKMLNGHSIGIELQNNGSEQYPEIQLSVLEDVAKALVLAYSLKDILGHSDISPGRKIDPGEHFPMSLFKSAVMATGCIETKTARTNLNLRDAPMGKLIKVLPKGSVVEVVLDKDNWSNVKLSDGMKGWVATAYLI